METEISNAELALLSLIVEQPRHAYEIEQVIEERNMRSWTEIGFSSIYRVLSKLEQAGWLSGKMEPPKGRGPARKVYHLTPAGKKMWQQASLQTLAKPKREYSSFLLGLDNLGALPPKRAQQAIQTYLKDQQATHKFLSQAVEEHPMRENFYIGIFFDYLLHQLAAEIKWLKKLNERLEKQPKALDHKRRSE
ncbi:MAG: helix-turn-helix transcriptional regulator [Chloroflexi bacterium]|nr:helix-turn-helix transcriptional regulator [Chloroflexota bacterium]